MELRPLIELSLILILASDTNGQKYMINVRDVNTPLHSDVTIPCNFTYKKPAENVHKLQVYWKISQRSKITTGDNDINAFIFHPNDTYVTEEYRGRTHLVGDINNQDCSLMIQNISHNVDRIYMRIATGNDFYNYKKSVRITVSGPGGTSAPFTDEVSTTDPSELTKMPRTSIYIATSVPIAAVLIVIFVLCGVFYYRKRKRSQAVTREESGYYANFSRASSTQAKREKSTKNQDSKQVSQPKVIDEPVYINVQSATDQRGSLDQTDNVYANVDYLKK
ncbi:uncharacterized protein [Centroberyx affinis]